MHFEISQSFTAGLRVDQRPSFSCLCFGILLSPSSSALLERRFFPDGSPELTRAGPAAVFAVLCFLSFPYSFPENPLSDVSGSARSKLLRRNEREPSSSSNEFVFRRSAGADLAFLMFLRGDRYFIFRFWFVASFVFICRFVFLSNESAGSRSECARSSTRPF